MSELVLGSDLLVAVEKLVKQSGDIERLRRVAVELLYCSQYLHEHDPRGDRQYGRYPCSGTTYHHCSMTTSHDPGCRAVGGDGTPKGEHWAKSCEPDCSESDPEPWCDVSGHDCGDCETVANLNTILAEAS